jgi:hypothetical protein
VARKVPATLKIDAENRKVGRTVKVFAKTVDLLAVE